MPIGDTQYVPDEKSLSEDHSKYKKARFVLGIPDHAEFFQLCSKWEGHPVSVAQARIDSVAMDHRVKRGMSSVKTFTAPSYVMHFVDRVLRGEIDLVTREPKRPDFIFDNLPRSEKTRRGQSVVSGRIVQASLDQRARQWEAAKVAG